MAAGTAVTIQLDEEIAKMYTSATPEEQENVALLFRSIVRDVMNSTRTLSDAMDDMSARAAERGLTPEIFEELLADE